MLFCRSLRDCDDPADIHPIGRSSPPQPSTDDEVFICTGREFGARAESCPTGRLSPQALRDKNEQKTAIEKQVTRFQEEILLFTRKLEAVVDTGLQKLEEERKHSYDVILEELAESRRWRGNVDARLDQHEEALAKCQRPVLECANMGARLDQHDEALTKSERPLLEHRNTHSCVDSLLDAGVQDKIVLSADRKMDEQSSIRTRVVNGSSPSRGSRARGRLSLIGSHKIVKGKYVFEKSVYDAMFFIFTESISNTASLSICAGFLLNLALHLGVLFVLASHFTKERLPNETITKLREWRASEGHAYQNADSLTGVSLVARVCALDESLSVSSGQIQLTENSLEYLGDRSLSDGQILCFVAVFLWNLTCALELRKSVQFAMAVLHDGFHLFDLSVSRLFIGCGVALCRSVISVLLLCAGSWWLAYTTAIEDLLLNASALGFALEIDDIIFQVLAPSSYLSVMTAAEPLPLPKLERHVPIVLAIGIASSALLVEVYLAGYTRKQLRLAHDALCSESTDLDFVVGTTQAGWLVYAESVPYDEKVSALVASKRAAVQYIIDQLPEANIYADNLSIGYREQHVGLVQRMSGMLFEEGINRYACDDYHGPKLGGRLWVASGVESVRGVRSCAEVRSYCTGENHSTLAKNVRSMCPVTCGCDDPLSGLWHLAGAEFGCPWRDCSQSIKSKLSYSNNVTYPCKDKSPLALMKGATWPMMLSRMLARGSINETTFDSMSRLGCAAIWPLSWETRESICGLYDVWEVDDAFLGAGVMCPVSCGCIFPYSLERAAQKNLREHQYEPGAPAMCPMLTCGQAYAADMAVVVGNQWDEKFAAEDEESGSAEQDKLEKEEMKAEHEKLGS